MLYTHFPDSESESEEEDFIGPQPKVEPLVRDDDALRKDAPVREWDVGKKRKISSQPLRYELLDKIS